MKKTQKKAQHASVRDRSAASRVVTSFIVRVPPPMLKALDVRARKNFRTRNSEVEAILAEKLKPEAAAA